MPDPLVTTGNVFEDSGVTFMARVLDVDGTSITQADVTGITYTVFTKTSATEVVSSTALVVADTIFDTLQTDSRWTTDTTGYNFRFTLADDTLTGQGQTYRVEARFDPASGEDFFVVFEPTTLAIVRS